MKIMVKIFLAVSIFIAGFPLLLRAQQTDSIVPNEQIVFPISRPRPRNVLPSEISKWLDHRYPKWEWVDNYAIFEYMHPDYLKDYPFNPNCISGDFNEDGKKDFAVQISWHDASNLSHVVIAFVSVKEGFKHYVIETNPGYLDHYLWLSKKGTKYHDYESEKESLFPTDTITIVVWEKAATSYFFKDSSFERVATAD